MFHLCVSDISLKKTYRKDPWIIFCAGRVSPFSPLSATGCLGRQWLHPWCFIVAFYETSKGPVFSVCHNSVGDKFQWPGEPWKLQTKSITMMVMMLQSGRIHDRDVQNYKDMLFRWSSGTCFFTCFWEDVKFETSSLGLAAISAEFWHMPTVGRGGRHRMCDIWIHLVDALDINVVQLQDVI